MSRSLDDILRRRARLQRASAGLRGQLSVHAAELARPLSWLARAEAGFRQALARPGLSALAAAAGLGLAYALGPRRTLGWGAKAWAAWRLWRKVRGG